MNNENEFRPHPYPFTSKENRVRVKKSITGQLQKLMEEPLFEGVNKDETLRCFNQYFTQAGELFKREEVARNNNQPGANLFYHCREHALDQATYDAIVTTHAIISRKDIFSNHLSREGALAIVLGAMHHDIGYVYGVNGNTNYAARTPIHVFESMDAYGELVDKIGLPQEFDTEKVKTLGKLGILNTIFPVNDEAKMRIKDYLKTLPQDTLKEAHIVRLAVQFADLGGQTARIDYFPNLVKKLRAEMNEEKDGKGTEIIGTDEELTQKAQGFINFVVKKMVGKTGNAFFGEQASPFFERWEKIGL